MSTLNDKSSNHHVIIGAVSFLSWWGAAEAASSVGSVAQNILRCFKLPWEWESSLAFGMNLMKSWYRALIHTPVLLTSVPNNFTVETGILGWVELVKLMMHWDFQINDLVMFGYACPSHFRPVAFQIMACAANVASDTFETWFPDSQRVSLFRVTRPKRSVAGYQF